METELDFEAISKDVLAIFRKHEVPPEAYGININVSARDFDALAARYPDCVLSQSQTIHAAGYTEGIQWAASIVIGP